MIRNTIRSSTLSPKRTFASQATKIATKPLQISQMNMIRESKDKFPMPAIISFDAFDTLYSPRMPIANQYYDIASKEFGIEKSLSSIQDEFPKVFAKLQEQYPNYGKANVEIETCDQWWSELIVDLFKIPHYNQDENSAELCKRLLTHFTGPDAYTLFDDVRPTLSKLKENNVKLVISSNSDSRLLEILRNLGISKYFDQNVSISYDLEVTKPNRLFFQKIAHKYVPASRNNSEKLEECWHVGDSYSQDYVGAVKAGWNGILVDRQHNSPIFQEGQSSKPKYEGCSMEKQQSSPQSGEPLIIANNRVVVRNLYEILSLFDIDK